MNDVQSLFQQAETERISGDTLKAIELYRQVIAAGDEHLILAKHMLGVSLRMRRQVEESEAVLREVLETELSDQQRAHVLRDLGDTLRIAEKYSEADQAFSESLKIFEAIGADVDERAATIGFQSRLLAAQKNYAEAIEHAETAAELFSQGQNHHAALYHNIFLARLLALSGRPEDARSKATELQEAAEKFGKAAHRERIQIILDKADDPAAMEEAIGRQENMS